MFHSVKWSIFTGYTRSSAADVPARPPGAVLAECRPTRGRGLRRAQLRTPAPHGGRNRPDRGVFFGLAGGKGGESLCSAAPPTPWYNAAAFFVAALLPSLLPRAARALRDERRPKIRGECRAGDRRGRPLCGHALGRRACVPGAFTCAPEAHAGSMNLQRKGHAAGTGTAGSRTGYRRGSLRRPGRAELVRARWADDHRPGSPRGRTSQ